jgi:O-antigen/teichoic acid export membrane protein
LGVVKKQGLINTVWVYLGTLIGFVSLLFIQPKFLTKDELGLTRLILSYGSVLSILFSFGISAVTVKYLPKVLGKEHRHRGFFGFIITYTLLSILIGLALLYGFKGFIFSFYKESAQAFNENFQFVILLTIINAFILGFNSYCIALLKTTVPSFLNDVVTRVLFIFIIMLHFWGYLNLTEFLLAFCLTYGVQCLCLLIYIFTIDSPGFRIDSKHINASIGFKPIVRYGIIITLTAINSVSLKYIDQMFVGRISLGDVGVYSVAAFIGLMIEIPLTALERVAGPSIAHALANNNLEEVKTTYYRSARFLLILGGWLFIMIAANLNPLLSFLPVDYQSSQWITFFISIGALINMATGINYPILVNSDKYIWGSVFMVSLILMTIIGNILLIPYLGVLGAAITTCIASIINNYLKFRFIKRRFQLQPFDLKTLYIFILILSLAGLTLFTQFKTSPFLLIPCQTLFFSALYFGILISFRWGSDLYIYLPAKIRSKFSLLN